PAVLDAVAHGLECVGDPFATALSRVARPAVFAFHAGAARRDRLTCGGGSSPVFGHGWSVLSGALRPPGDSMACAPAGALAGALVGARSSWRSSRISSFAQARLSSSDESVTSGRSSPLL